MDEFELFKQREADYASEFEKLVKDYFYNLDSLRTCPRDAHEDPYLAGYSEILEGARESIKAFIDEDNLRKDYPKAFKEMREKYHQMYLGLKKSTKCDFNDGRFRAAHRLYEGLNTVIQSAAEFDHKQLQKHQAQRKGD